MTKQEAIDYISKLDDRCGVFVEVIEDMDIERYMTEDFVHDYHNMTDKEQRHVLSVAADQCSHTLEWHGDYGIRDLLRCAIDAQTAEDVLKYYDDECVAP